MIFDALVARLRSRFPDAGMQVKDREDAPGARSIVFPAAHHAVGELVIWGDGDEATVFVGSLTHGHFGCYDRDVSNAVAADRVAAEVEAFLAELLAGRVIIWTAFGGTAGGWKRVADRPQRAPRSMLRRWFLWSGPLPK